jgi:hypothetical protein
MGCPGWTPPLLKTASAVGQPGGEVGCLADQDDSRREAHLASRVWSTTHALQANSSWKR